MVRALMTALPSFVSRNSKEYGTADCLGWARSRGSDFACAWWQFRLNAPCSAPQKTLGRNLHASWAAFDLFVAVQHQRQRSSGPSFVFGFKSKLLLFHVRLSLLAGFSIFHTRERLNKSIGLWVLQSCWLSVGWRDAAHMCPGHCWCLEAQGRPWTSSFYKGVCHKLIL